MTRRSKVNKGDPILPNMSAEWYNDTIREPTSNPKTHPQREHRGHTIPTFVTAAREAFDPVVITGVKYPPNDVNKRRPALTANAGSSGNWGVVQEPADGLSDITRDVILWGITWANVTINGLSDPLVDLVDGVLESGDEGKARLLYANASGPSMILLGTHVNLKHEDITLIKSVTFDGMDLWVTTHDVKVPLVGEESEPIRVFEGNVCPPEPT